MLIGLPRIYGCWHMILCGFLQHGGLAENVLDHRLNSRTVLMNPVIETDFGVSQPSPFGEGNTVVVPDTNIDIQQQDAYLRVVEGADLVDVVNALNALGATPQDLMAILEALKASGSLRAELEIL